jgi:hypothetical protein
MIDHLQVPAEGILLHRDYGDIKTYKVVCSCGSDDCSHDVWVEADGTGVTVTTYTTQKTPLTFSGLINRLRLTKDILLHGFVKYEADIVMTRQQAINYASTLINAVEDVEQFRKVHNVED